MSRYYSNRELLSRAIWTIARPLLFSISPRLFYGWRNMVLRLFGATIGNNVQIFPSANITYPWLLTVGDRVVISWDVKVYNLGRISIGDDTVISQYVHLCGGTHDYKNPGFTLLRTGLTIGKKVWVAADAFVGPGVTVGDHVVVGARSVVMRDVAPGTVVAGNPARVVSALEVNRPVS